MAHWSGPRRGNLPQKPKFGHATERVDIDDNLDTFDVYRELGLQAIH